MNSHCKWNIFWNSQLCQHSLHIYHCLTAYALWICQTTILCFCSLTNAIHYILLCFKDGTACTWQHDFLWWCIRHFATNAFKYMCVYTEHAHFLYFKPCMCVGCFWQLYVQENTRAHIFTKSRIKKINTERDREREQCKYICPINNWPSVLDKQQCARKEHTYAFSRKNM